ncbi:MAG TPA: glyceraldehyde 3-phosphate dehydrogenase NAD-binding domain-containing protein [Bacteroidales bacterium]|nr:glyceraldehyde 3-phosphate dehydrogenase NAD-binding domain-containing protein [Bacteroidales bacterium]HRZ48629.1 glyceraldehyde 3-phosphate dehydrogenase NAD-binding domain-containing protein [Bacteroidales bacterium]
MSISINEKKLLGINGLGRIGKLTLWYHLLSRQFDGVVINVGREVGKGLGDMIHAMESDSTYGSLSHFLYGFSGRRCEIRIIDESVGLLEVDGFPVKVMRRERNPRDTGWLREGVRIVVDCTGKFLDPTLPGDDPRGSLMGHLTAGAHKVIASAPFKIKDKTLNENLKSPTLIYGVNHLSYLPDQHHIVSAASCTTTGLAHMVLPLLEDPETMNVLTASMSTVHAATNTQSVLDTVPTSGTSDLRKNRSAFNNIILSTTGAAATLEKVLPQIINFGFMADSVRIPTTTVSLISLNITFNSRMNGNGTPVINAGYINQIYNAASEGPQKGLLHFSKKQNVSVDLLGFPAAVVIEGHETHTRTGFLKVPHDIFESLGISNIQDINIPVTHAKIMGWYDNEFGSYVNCLGKLTEYIASKEG